MQLSYTQIIGSLLQEAFVYRKAVVGVFIAVNILAIGSGAVWPLQYTSWSTIIVDEKNIIEPLMKGTAVTTDVTDRAKLAKEVIYGRKLMSQVAALPVWLSSGEHSAKEVDGLITKVIIPSTQITNVDKNLIRIQFTDTNAERAYATTKKIAELFIFESLAEKAKESQDAYDFISKQTEEYHEKLVNAEAQLKEFHSSNLDAQPGSEGLVGTRINSLEEKIEQTQNDLNEAETKKASLEKQLSGEAEVTAAFTRDGQYRTRIGELQQQLETLRLSYQDTYPDIVRLKHQIEDLREAIAADEKERALGKGRPLALNDEAMSVNPLFQELRRELSQTKTLVDTLQARLSDNRRLLASATVRGRRVHDSEAALAELSRDYQVNRDLYQDLLKRRENARVSMNLDIANQGLTFKIHEPAMVPQNPSGPRFPHFVIGGLIIGLLLPFGLLYMKQQLDPRLRMNSTLSDKLKLQVLAVIPHLSNPAEVRDMASTMRTLSLLIVLDLGVVAIVAALKSAGVI